MKNKLNISTILFTILLNTLIFSQNQNVILKTETGFMAVHNSYELSFTLRIDGDDIPIPQWTDDYTLNLIEDYAKLSLFSTNEIIKNSPNLSNNEKLLKFQKWETNYIEKNMTENVERSRFIKDTFDYGQNELNYNAWYYSVNIDKSDIYFYFFDILSDDNLFRLEISFMPNLKIPRTMSEVIFSNLITFDGPIDLDKLKRDIIKGDY